MFAEPIGEGGGFCAKMRGVSSNDEAWLCEKLAVRWRKIRVYPAVPALREKFLKSLLNTKIIRVMVLMSRRPEEALQVEQNEMLRIDATPRI